MSAVTSRGPSPLQRRVLIVLAAMEQRGTHRVRTRDLEHLLAQGGEVPVYGPNLRASCRRMENAGWLRTLRAPNLQLAVELTDAGHELAVPLLAAEQERVLTQQRAAEVWGLPLIPAAHNADTSADDRPVQLDGCWQVVMPRRLCYPSRRNHLPAAVELGWAGDTYAERSSAGGNLAASLP